MWPSEPGDHTALMALDAAVHRFVYRAAGNPYLEETLSRYFNLSLRIWYLALDRLPHVGARVHEHREVLAAILAGEPERARARHGRARRDLRARDPRGAVRRRA